ncbi:hypothetical protein BO99DRAFT_170957 [Aspergillus violaceofuscus CBS 115571]|uniref:Uncharacterized protein n=1 Tax=Aspergillus violaceofuscus (strain CBS 115571) TaxID=1450538 RepID=A0A2V5HB04_ASPV1|nr:hypothetical protein BO99DRAFT_170957 [Aspergillus violaceofuscus CBS 115571]
MYRRFKRLRYPVVTIAMTPLTPSSSSSSSYNSSLWLERRYSLFYFAIWFGPESIAILRAWPGNKTWAENSMYWMNLFDFIFSCVDTHRRSGIGFFICCGTEPGKLSFMQLGYSHDRQ